MDDSHARRPGLAKTRGERLVRARAGTWLVGSDGRFRAMFEAADTVSEGSVKIEDGGAVWYGTTSVILAWPASLADSSRDFVAAVAAKDPHVRLRAIRLAHREACLRAPGALGRVECEVSVAAHADGLRIDVDVQAPLTLPRNAELSGRGPAS